MSKRFGKNDLIFLLVLLVLLGAAFVYFYVWNRTDGSRVEISIDGALYETYDLYEDTEISIPNGDGTVTNILRISGGEAKMIEADCPDKLCMHQNAISLAGENIVCLPNKVVCTVVNEEEDAEFDAIVK
jgi:hypothetical protein